MLKVYNLTISKHAIFLFHTFLCWKRCIFFFFHFGLFVCGLGIPLFILIYVCVCLGLFS